MPEQPNLLVVFADQHRWCDLGCYGNTQVRSPHLDAFAGEALRFTPCFSNSPVCVPARGSLLTGRLPLGHGALTNDLPMRHGTPCVAEVMAGAGYHTGYIGKWHLAGVPRDGAIPAGPGRFGFQEWKVCNCSHRYLDAYYFDEENRRVRIEGYEPVEQTRLAADTMRRHRGEPWCLFLSWGPPHDPYSAVPPEYLEQYRAEEMLLRPNVAEEIVATRTRIFPREQARQWLRGYYAHVTALDEQFGRLMRALEETGQRENTVVVYTSDHGDMLGSQGLTNKQVPYEESVRVPLLVSWPGHVRAGACKELVGLVDLPVSLLGLLGLRFPEAVDGTDLRALFTDAGAAGLDECYLCELVACHQAADRGEREWRAIRTRRHTFARTAADGGYALFDNEQDPYQMRNLVHEPAAQSLRRELLARLDALITRHDRLLPWEEFIRHFGYREEWNRSQEYFRRPTLDA